MHALLKDEPTDRQVSGKSYSGMLDIIQEGARRAEIENDSAYARMIQFRKAFMYNDHRDYLKIIIDQMFESGKQRDLVNKLMDTTSNIVAYVINQIACLYRGKMPSRKFQGVSEEQEAMIAEIYRSAKCDKKFAIVNERVLLLNDVLVLFQFHEPTGQVIPEILDRENCRVETDDRFPDIITRLEVDAEVRDETGALMPVVFVYTAERNFMLKGDEELPIPGNPDMINPLGVIPAVAVHLKYNPRYFWDSTSGNDLFDAALKLCFFLSCKNYNIFMGLFKMLIILGAMPGMGKDLQPVRVEIGAGEILTLPHTTGTGAASATVADFSIDFDNAWKAFQMSFKFTLKQYGIDGTDLELIDSKLPEAGVSMTIRKGGETEARAKYSPVFQEFEADFFKMLKIVWNYYQPEKVIPEAATVEVVFPTIEYFNSAEEKLKILKERVREGVLSAANFFMEFNPDVNNPEEAITKMKENLAQYKEVYGVPDFKVSPEQIPGMKYETGAQDEEEEDISDEEKAK